MINAEAVQRLRPGVEFSMGETFDSIVYHSDTKPITQAEFDSEVFVVKSEREASAYKSKRAVDYPNIGDQLDALFHAGVFPAEMSAKIQAVKDKYPK